MNLCVVFFQAIIFAVFVVQYQFFVEVEAEKPTSFSVGNWFNSIEKKINVQGMMSDVFQNIRKTAEDIAQIPGREMRPAIVKTDNLPKKEDVEFNDGVPSNDWGEISAVGHDASDVTGEKNDADQETPTREQLTAIKKKRMKKHKRKNRNKERIADISMEKDRAEFSRRIKKERKKKVNKRRFVKTSVKESNVSDSDESMKRGKPVDIIVHIKMNE